MASSTSHIGSSLGETNRFQIVAIRIDDIRSVIGGAVVSAQVRRAIVTPARCQSCAMEVINCCAARCTKGDVRTFGCRLSSFVQPQSGCVLRPEARPRTVEDVTKRREHGGVKAATRFDISNMQSNVIEHDGLSMGWRA